MTMSDFNITLFETCELLNRSKKSISRYIRRGLLHPERVKSKQGTLEYRFSKADIDAFKTQEALRADETGQDRGDGTEETGHSELFKQIDFTKNKENKGQTEETGQRRGDRTGQTRQDSEVVTILKETTGILQEQLKTKDEQIKKKDEQISEFLERDREKNILLKGLQDKVLMLEQPKESDETGQDRGDGTGQDKEKPTKAGFWKRDLKFFSRKN